ncbi:hypothetical protein [Ligilactobacillus animalis]|uniref:hypothetical protein n=1 Tax=Ligilactobacillus animalis TaxID=1605 RepID=UPI0011DDA69D|nr:hypothetical protein [Ligilactobacillus animalis]
MKVKNIWESDYAVIYEIDDKCYLYNKQHNETPSLMIDQEVSASELGEPYNVIKCRGLYPKLAFSPEMKKVDHVDQRVQAD